MRNLADAIENFIIQEFMRDRDDALLVKRSDLAEKLSCAPSQISYVLSTRFTPERPVILMTAWGSIDLAVKGMQAGAFDFITKPWNNAALMLRIETALELNGKKKEEEEEEVSKNGDTFDRSAIIGKSKALMDVLATIKRICRTNASVLITGESGTGKELIAEAVHKNSPRAKKPFVKVNLGGISQSLFESEMFGHKKGAFTDASSDRVGRFELADKGTIFLDEIGRRAAAIRHRPWGGQKP